MDNKTSKLRNFLTGFFKPNIEHEQLKHTLLIQGAKREANAIKTEIKNTLYKRISYDDIMAVVNTCKDKTEQITGMYGSHPDIEIIQRDLYEIIMARVILYSLETNNF